MTYERPNIAAMQGYIPGEQPQTSQILKLNTNEHPNPPCEAVLDALKQIDPQWLRRYPSPRADAFREVASQVHHIHPDQIMATNGGDELLRLAITVFCTPNTRTGGIGLATPTYSLYDTLAQIHDTPVTRVPLNQDWSIPDDFADRLNDADCQLAILVNPHAPSGRLESQARLKQIACAFRGVLLIDEAYVDFAQSDALDLVRDPQLDNILILRTLSKGYSLAGLRFGYGLGSEQLINAMHKARDSYNTDAISQHLASVALRHRDEISRTWKQLVAERQRMTEQLTGRGLAVTPSQTNFLLVQVPDAWALCAGDLYQTLKKQGILVRYFDQDRLRDCLRITLGTPTQNNQLLEALDLLN